ncbi:isoleucine--tRNA ligase [Alteriqipengyuania lutimaris]|uniref:Isoleucine--tRNA ligase n=1 Tax=Alteriqipengyuania lutimaris TaxID=1538146 RepID=A0A395LPK6_9SPHN|nr:isoleucine--tRNA ligase [Alteriqipengyuania lutimaris]MBB3034467.1 isoleucyl-tRNA synthetase [Alteriqipengyuania lutimaris]RDS76640.1 isoleucine--tRNA ligase [Alteriqipengyuania lutimaris]
MSDDTKKDWRDTVFLPKTDFPMKAGLPQKEPGILAGWQDSDLHAALRAERAGAEKFILHDGPPYANGDIHVGHALNHILKDMVVRTQSLLGKDAPYVPGWDCHGLPIEWKVEEQYRKKKLNKDEVPRAEFRAECRAYARKWVDTQREQLKRLGILGDWDNPYLTMDYDSEATIVAELMKFAEAGNLYRGSKPVMWSPVEKTALAEAEVEYEDITSTQIDVAFEIVESPIPELAGAHAVIWTTTPWTIPVNQALAYGPEVEYALISWPNVKYLVARELAAEFITRITSVPSGQPMEPWPEADQWDEHLKLFKGSDLAGTKVRHPMHTLGGFYEKLRPMLPGDFVTTDSGTGLVHMSPDHGEDDFYLCRENGIDPVFAVDDGGVYRDDWPWLGGDDERRRAVINPKFNAPDGPICSDLSEAGALLSASADYKHSYPHSWRSKAKIIYRCTPQWFVPMDKPLSPSPLEGRGLGEGASRDALGQPLPPTPSPEVEGENTLRSRAMGEIERVRFVPERGRNRIRSMVEGRPDWVLSRQRAWGVPITLFVRKDGTYLQDAAVNQRVVDAIREGGVDAWDEGRTAEFLGTEHNPDDFEMVHDILDVWFDSGCTHVFVLESDRWPALTWPANLYLEGSDQHRGWFQSSLLESCATRGRAPYDQVLTHGFTMDQNGRKMSKSLGNTVDPLKIVDQYGADILRLWALSVDSTMDHRIGDEILKGVADQYRKLRNTFRYMLGALEGYEASEAVDYAEMPELERYTLHQLAQLDVRLRQAITEYDFNEYTRLLTEFANEDLSAFLFDIRKDRLYCDDPAWTQRRAYRTVLDTLFQALVRYAAPVLVFTAEEVWTTRFPEAKSIHLQQVHPLPGEWLNEKLATRFAALRELREDVTEAIEPLRREKTIRSSNEAAVSVPAKSVPEGFDMDDLAELFIAASVATHEGEGVTVTRSSCNKCGRCWRLLPSVSEDGDLCDRCEKVVD